MMANTVTSPSESELLIVARGIRQPLQANRQGQFSTFQAFSLRVSRLPPPPRATLRLVTRRPPDDSSARRRCPVPWGLHDSCRPIASNAVSRRAHLDCE